MLNLILAITLSTFAFADRACVMSSEMPEVSFSYERDACLDQGIAYPTGSVAEVRSLKGDDIHQYIRELAEGVAGHKNVKKTAQYRFDQGDIEANGMPNLVLRMKNGQKLLAVPFIDPASDHLGMINGMTISAPGLIFAGTAVKSVTYYSCGE